ncbi:MAG TPA: hypothetical protein VJX74_19490 [Blastocatellia bacterium]|nr:hypothetical protein [Blastocatellia bacterium]
MPEFTTHFGTAGTRTVHKSSGIVIVDQTQGQFLTFKLSVKGAQAVFTFACKHRPLLSEINFPGHPLATYEWEWLKQLSDFDAHDDQYGVRMSFVPAIKYTLVVDHCDATGTVIERLKQIDYESADSQDKFEEPLRVFTS